LSTAGNVIASIFRERDSHAVYLLEKQGITRFDVAFIHDLDRLYWHTQRFTLPLDLHRASA